MTKEKKDVPSKRAVKPQKTEGNKLSRRSVIKSIAAGGLVLGVAGASGVEALASHDIVITTTPDEALKFINGLTQEPFRERLSRNPKTVFEEFHMRIPEKFIPPPPIQLPPVDQVKKVLEEWQRVGQLSPQFFVPVFLAFFAFFAFFKK